MFGSMRVMSALGKMGTVAALVAVSVSSWAGAPEIGQAAPALVVQKLDGQAFDLRGLHGKVIVVNFWATWCSPCRAEMPQLDSFYRHYHQKGVELLGVSIDDLQERGEVDKVMRKFSYPAALLSTAKVNEFGPPMAVPMTYVIDGGGVVRARLLPGRTSITERSLGEVVEPLLGLGKIAQPHLPGAVIPAPAHH